MLWGPVQAAPKASAPIVVTIQRALWCNSYIDAVS